ncbi:MAG: hypothetical protein BWY70_00092 [Bacteroidetes bacterium ADurb.Bin408]|nr:MAG: hypothetical protein BWY70_00092 [Bacteroidetes bacterium ADurb.Bin408]
MRKLIILIFFLSPLFFLKSQSQNIAENISKSDIYEFLDELANNGIIELTSVVKPYSRAYIAYKLKEADNHPRLNARQRKELIFFLNDYGLEQTNTLPPDFLPVFIKKYVKGSLSINPPGYFYADSLFRVGIRPVVGVEYFSNNNGQIHHRFNGADMFADIDKRLSVYASLVDNNESEMISKPNFLTRRTGANYKKNVNNSGRNDFSEMQGGIMYNWKWGGLGLVKEPVQWGNNYNGALIFSGRTPTFAQIKFTLYPVGWLRFNYFHGWLISNVLDSSRSYYDSQNTYRGVFHEKYLAANMFTLSPFKKLDVSFGNSIIYSDIGIQPAYLIPFMFFKSIDHTLNSTNNNRGQNAQMFFDVSSRLIPHTHLYTSVFVDEIMLRTMFDKTQHRNQLSFKAGLRIDNIIPNTDFTGEYTRSNPWAYRHYISTTTFASNTYNLGHYLRDNAEEYYVAATYKPLRGLKLKFSYCKALKGEEYAFGTISDTGTPFLQQTVWRNETYSASVVYQIFNNVKLFSAFNYSEINDKAGIYTPDFFKGTQRTFSFGCSVGL